MARWSNGDIVWESAALAGAYGTNEMTARAKSKRLLLYIHYLKGTEGYAELQLYFDNSNREQLLAQDPLYDDWFGVSADGDWPNEGNQDAASVDYVPVRNIPWRFDEAGFYRIAVDCLPRECYFKVAARCDAPAGAPGSLRVRFATDELSWGGVGQGNE